MARDHRMRNISLHPEATSPSLATEFATGNMSFKVKEFDENHCCWGDRPLSKAFQTAMRYHERMRVPLMLQEDSGGGGGGRKPARNVLGERLEVCSLKPTTGFFRDGCCDTSREDVGSHTVCAVMTEEFLAFSKSRGNDLSTPMPEYGFPGLKPGDRWCLCAPRWQEAFEAGSAPRVVLRGTHEGAVAHCSLPDLKRFAVDID